MIEGARLVTPEGTKEGFNFLIEGARIKRIFEAGEKGQERADRLLRLDKEHRVSLTIIGGREFKR